MLASYGLLGDELPPTVVMALWHGGFSARRNPFAMCYYAKRYSFLGVLGRDAERACEYLKRFGRTREEQARNYYLWAQTVPKCWTSGISCSRPTSTLMQLSPGPRFTLRT